jgi:UTP:GlnB (protein PII) uridylyltransferase
MQACDLIDPRTVREIAARVETAERLKPHAANLCRHRRRQSRSDDLGGRGNYGSSILRFITRSRARSNRSASNRRRRAVRVRGVLEELPKRYPRTRSEEKIHDRLALDAVRRHRGVAVEIRKRESAWELTLIAADGPGLFVSAAGTLAGFGMNILRAEAFSNRRGLVLDTFRFADPNRTLDLNPSEIDRLRLTAERVVSGRKDVRELLKNRPKPQLPSPKARIPAAVSFESGSERGGHADSKSSPRTGRTKARSGGAGEVG